MKLFSIELMFTISDMTDTYKNRRLLVYVFRNSRPEVFCEKGVLKKFTKFTGKYLCQSP